MEKLHTARYRVTKICDPSSVSMDSWITSAQLLKTMYDEYRKTRSDSKTTAHVYVINRWTNARRIGNAGCVLIQKNIKQKTKQKPGPVSRKKKQKNKHTDFI